MTNPLPITTKRTFKEVFHSDSLNETFNKPILIYILKNWDDFKDKINNTNDNGDDNSYDCKTIIENYLKKSKNTNVVSVVYKKGSSSLKQGRYFADKSLSIQNLPRCIRHSICKDIWIDLDFNNCHPNILQQLCKFYGVNCHYLSKYNKNRDDFLNQIMVESNCSRDDAKKYILKTLNGGDVNINVKWWKALKTEFSNIASSIATHKDFKKIYDNAKSIKTNNLNARTMNSVLCIYENYCLESFYQYLSDNGIIKNFQCSLIFDGLQVMDNPLNRTTLTIDFLKDASNYIKSQVGLYLDISIKDFNECLDINLDEIKSLSYDFYNDTRSDIIYANNILTKFKERCYSISDGVLFMYDEDTGMWSFDEVFHRKICLKYAVSLFPNIFSKDNRKTFDSLFSTAIKSVKSLAPRLDNWNNDDTQIGFLLFNNGVLDMKNYEMLDFHPKYKFTKRIERNFDINVNYCDGCRLICERLYNKQFTNQEKKDYFLERLSRGIAGEYLDREFVLGIGETSCGKGKQTILLQNSFGEFIQCFNGEELLVKKNSNSDTARDLSFIHDIFDSRVSISNELEIKVEGSGKNAKLNGLNCNRIKKLTGGDKFMVRRLFKNPMPVINKSMPLLLLNDIPEVDGADDAYIRRANYIEYDRSSSTIITNDNDTFFVADDTIDDFINEPYIIDSYVSLMCRKYAKSCSFKLERPKCVASISKQMSGYNDSNDEYFTSNYTLIDADTIKTWIKTDKNDKGIWLVYWGKVGDYYIECSKMYKKYLDDGFTGSRILFGKKLFKMGIIVSQKKINGKCNNVYVGITDDI